MLQIAKAAHPKHRKDVYAFFRTSISNLVVIAYECPRGEVDITFGTKEGHEWIDTGGSAFSRNAGRGEAHTPTGYEILAWREWAGAWRVLDPRVSTILPIVDNYVDGE